MRSFGIALALILVGCVACSDDESSKVDAGGDALVETGSPSDTLAEIGAGSDVSTDVSDTATPDDTATDTAQDTAQCGEGAWECSADAHVLLLCQDGAWVEEPCWDTDGTLCEEGACVPTWEYGAPQWGTCPDEPLGTVETMAEKATYYDAIVPRLHLHPDLGWVMPVTLPKEEVACTDGQEPPCYAPTVTEAEATWQDVETWHTGENDGLWNGLYMASQAYRYAVTKDPEALANLQVTMASEVDRMAITGVPGIFTRQLIPPGVAGIGCPTDDAHYTTDVEKDDNRWVKITDDGCATVVDHETGEWVVTDHCGLEAYAGWCWLDNVSQDEYAGHILALGSIWKLVDDEALSATAADLLGQVGTHLMEHDLAFVDWDGRVTEHGKLWPMSMADVPGFLAMESMCYLELAAVATGDPALQAYYDDCLLQKSGEVSCVDQPLMKPEPFTDYLELTYLYFGDEGCESNWNNFSMNMVSYHTFLMYEHDLPVRRAAQAILDTAVMRPDEPKALIVQGNAWYNFMWAASKPLGPDTDGPAFDAIEDAICAMKQFPASQATPTLDSASKYEHYCEGRLGDSLAEFPVPVAERCPRTFLWWACPYKRHSCEATPWKVSVPSDYLLAYWMGRYYGFISETM